jgi:isopentenyl diphosphate isomerase/L-lactate dehydrogenase-like FMN-dependent dehydrogenase
VTLATNAHLLPAARSAVDDATWAYLIGGAGSEATLRRNRIALDRLAFVPRIFRDVSSIDPTTTLFGCDFRIPVMMAPVGSLDVFHEDGAEGVAGACRGFGTMQVVAGVGPIPPNGAGRAFQLYLSGDHGRLRDTIETVEASGYAAIVITGDVAHRARRERQDLAGFSIPGKPPPDRSRLAGATWTDVETLRDMTRLPLVVKGIQTGADAEIAAGIGVDGVWVSNHGGRQLDHGRSSLESLVEAVDVVGRDIAVVVDGGFLTGSDVLKALALGADLVALGKLQCLALAAAGEAGVLSMLEVLEAEITSQMGLLGVSRLADLGRAHVCESAPSGLPDPTDPWSHLR